MAISLQAGMVGSAQLAVFAPGFRAAGSAGLTRAGESPTLASRARRLSGNQTQISRLEELKDALVSLNASANHLAASSRVSATANYNTAESTDSSVLTASADGTANEDVFTIDVFRLAQSQKLVSGKVAGASTRIGSGVTTTLSITFGSLGAGNRFNQPVGAVAASITIDSGNNTLAGIAAAINAADAGAVARVVDKDGGAALEFESALTGAANSMKITVSGDATLSELLTFDPESERRMTQTQAAQDASFSFGGTQISSASNEVSDLLRGITISLAGTGEAQLNIKPAETALTKPTTGLVTNFTDSYSRLVSLLNSLKADAFLDDEAVIPIEKELSDSLVSISSAVTDSLDFRSLKEIGISENSDGTLEVDRDVLDDAVEKNAANVTLIFTGNNQGVADRVSRYTAAEFAGGNIIDREIGRLTAESEEALGAHEAETSFENAGQLAFATQYAEVGATPQTALLDGRTLSGLPGAIDSFGLRGGRAPALNRLLLTQANLAYQTDLGGNLRSYPGSGYQTVA